MRIGDKVRLLKGTEEGFIVSIKGNIVEIEIEDGFTIPAVKNEVVVIDIREKEAFHIPEEEKSQEKTSRLELISEGIYLGIEDSEPVNCYIVNQTENRVLFSLNVIEKKNFRGFASGFCESFSAQNIGQTSILQSKDEIKFLFQGLVHAEKSKFINSPIETHITIKKSELTEKVFVNTLEKEITLIDVEKIPSLEIDPHKIKEQLIGGTKAENEKSQPHFKQKEQTIDLHINPDKINLPENEILGYQLELFERSFDQAILSNAKSLKVIHGIGSGKLRNAIHKRISKRKEVRYYEDGNKEKFGFGSTIIHF